VAAVAVAAVVDVAAVVVVEADVARSVGRVATQDEKSGTR
jgi:hypothetical protein